MNHASIPHIQLENVNISRNGKTILHNVNWEIRTHQHWAIVGPNGSGKTLLMQAIQRRIPCSSGKIKYGEGLTPALISQVSFELQQQLIAHEIEQEEFRQYLPGGEEGTTVLQYFGNNQPGFELDPNLSQIILQMELSSLINAPLVTLSNGEMRKVLISKTLQKSPKILILDEPFDGLDSSSKEQLSNIIDKLTYSSIQILLVTHRVDEISDRMTHLISLRDGTVKTAGKRNKRLINIPASKASRVPENSEGIYIGGDESGPKKCPEFQYPLTPTIVMKNVSVIYDDKVVIDQLNWVVNHNENWAIVGPNGAGKTTLLRLIAAEHLQAYSNDITLFGRRRGSGETIWEIKQKIGLLSPEIQIQYRENLLASEVVLSGFFDSIGLYRPTIGDQKKKAKLWLDFLEIGDLGNVPVNQLSYGQKRMVLLARALVKSPQLLLMDEPCQGLDIENCGRLSGIITVLSKEKGTQIIFVTHRQNEIPACISHILEFRKKATEPYPEHRFTTETYEVTTR